MGCLSLLVFLRLPCLPLALFPLCSLSLSPPIFHSFILSNLSVYTPRRCFSARLPDWPTPRLPDSTMARFKPTMARFKPACARCRFPDSPIPDCPTPRFNHGPLQANHGPFQARMRALPLPRFPDCPAPRLADSPTGRLRDSPTPRVADCPAPRLADSPTGRLPDSPTGRLPD